MARPRPRRRKTLPPLSFSRRLARRQWLLGQLGIERFDQLGRSLRENASQAVFARYLNRSLPRA